MLKIEWGTSEAEQLMKSHMITYASSRIIDGYVTQMRMINAPEYTHPETWLAAQKDMLSIGNERLYLGLVNSETGVLLPVSEALIARRDNGNDWISVVPFSEQDRRVVMEKATEILSHGLELTVVGLPVEFPEETS